jgi:hypothetical protein
LIVVKTRADGARHRPRTLAAVAGGRRSWRRAQGSRGPVRLSGRLLASWRGDWGLGTVRGGVRRWGTAAFRRVQGCHRARPGAGERLLGASGRGLDEQLLVNADVVSGQRVHGQLQEGQGRSADKVRGDGWERRKGWHVRCQVAGMVWVLGHGDQERGEQWLVLVMGGVRELQGSRDGQLWTWSKVKMRYGHKVYSCLPGVWLNARKRKSFKFLKILWWISNIYS